MAKKFSDAIGVAFAIRQVTNGYTIEFREEDYGLVGKLWVAKTYDEATEIALVVVKQRLKNHKAEETESDGQ